jgi:hypothetical protein
MEGIENNQVYIESKRKAVKSRDQRHRLIVVMLIIAAVAGSAYACFQMVTGKLNIDGASFIVVGCVIGVVLIISLLDRFGL